MKKKELKEKLIDALHELDVTNKLLDQRQEVLLKIPACPLHGFCLPSMSAWVDKMITIDNLLSNYKIKDIDTLKQILNRA